MPLSDKRGGALVRWLRGSLHHAARRVGLTRALSETVTLLGAADRGHWIACACYLKGLILISKPSVRPSFQCNRFVGFVRF